MEKRIQKPFASLFSLSMASGLLVLMLSSCVTGSQNNWLQTGVDVLNTMNGGQSQKPLTRGEIGAAFKEALHIGTERVTGQLGRRDGFQADPAIHIPLPREFHDIQKTLKKIGFSALLDDVELKLNRAAEVATPKAKRLFWQAITQMTFDDVIKIYKGPENSATLYFQGKMSTPLAAEMRPIIAGSLSKVGAIQAYDRAIGKYKSLPFVPDVRMDLTDYVTDKGIQGIFYYIAKEEAAIRKDPAKRTTQLLKRVFGAT